VFVQRRVLQRHFIGAVTKGNKSERQV